MAPQGKGISDAVRDSVRTWMTDSTVDLLYKESNYKLHKGGFGLKVKDSKSWVRRNRLSAINGWIRNYDSNVVDDVTLQVKTNSDDTRITYVSIKAKGKVVAGGKVSVPSKLVSQRGKDATLVLDEQFIEFTPAEVEKIQKMSDADKAISDMISLLCDERVF